MPAAQSLRRGDIASSEVPGSYAEWVRSMDPVSFYRMNDYAGADSVLVDEISGLNGTWKGEAVLQASLVSGDADQATYCKSETASVASGHAEMGAHHKFLSGSFSVVFLYKCIDIGGASSGARVMGNDQANGWYLDRVGYAFSNWFRLDGYIRGMGWGPGTGNWVGFTGNTYLLGMVYNADTDEGRLWINGVSPDNQAFERTGLPQPTSTTEVKIGPGGHVSGVPSYKDPDDHILDEIAIFDRVLTPQEHATLQAVR